MKCHCGLPTQVIDSRAAPGGHWRRRRECSAGHRTTTYEAPVNPEFGDPAVALNDLVRLIRRARLVAAEGNWLDDPREELLDRLINGPDDCKVRGRA